MICCVLPIGRDCKGRRALWMRWALANSDLYRAATATAPSSALLSMKETRLASRDQSSSYGVLTWPGNPHSATFVNQCDDFNVQWLDNQWQMTSGIQLYTQGQFYHSLTAQIDSSDLPSTTNARTDASHVPHLIQCGYAFVSLCLLVGWYVGKVTQKVMDKFSRNFWKR